MIFGSLPAGPRRLSALPLTRHALLVGTILGAGVIMVAPVARAANQMINLTTPQTNATTEYIADGSDSITVNQAAGATISNGSTDGIYASTLNGSINLGGTTGLQASISGVSGVTGIVTDGAGSITIKSVAGGTINGTLGRGVLTRANSGTTTIDLGANATGNGEGIDAASTSGNITIKTASGTTITGGSGAIVTNSTAGGATSITFNGDVKSAAGSAIWAQSTSGTIEITGSGNATRTDGATAAGGGIGASTQTGAIIVGGTGNTSGSGGAMVNLQITGQSAQTNIVVMRSGSYTATNGAAIYAKNEGSGAVNLVNLGSITQTGAFAFNLGYPNAAVIVKANGEINIGGVAGLSNAVTSDNSGIYAETTGNKDINIRTATGGTITAKNGVAIQTSAETGTTNINIGDTVSGATTGIYATSTTGAINITSTSTVTGNSDYAIVADNHLATVAIGDSGVKSTATNATVRIDSATGIYISNSGNGGNNGAIVVLTKGAISSSANGIEVSNVGDAITIGESETKITNAVSGWRGILASNTGANGTISITTGAGGAVTGTRNQGIATSAQGGATNISLGDTVTGATKGVLSNATTGAINITSTSTVTGTGDYAIAAANNLAIVTIGSDSGGESTATNATVKINSSTGIVAKNGGNGGNNGAVTVQTLGAVTSSGIGIDASNVGDAINIGTSAAKITNAVSGTTGINAANTGTGTISILTGAGGTVRGTSGAGITSQAENGATTITTNGAVSGTTNGIYATSTSGAITIDGAGTISSSTANNEFGAILALASTGAITVGGSGNVSGNGNNAVGLGIAGRNATADITITRSGTYTANNGAAIAALNSGTGGINISGLGTVIATGSWGVVDLAGAISARATGGNINIGGDTGLANSVTSDLDGISAKTTGTGTITIKTAAGGSITARNGNAINTIAVNGATTVTIGAGSTVTGTTNAIQTTTTNGNVTVNNAGTVNGSLKTVLSSGGTGTFTFNNAGTFSLGSYQTNFGFTINNQSGGVLTGIGFFGVVNAASGSTILAGDRAIAVTSGTSEQRTLNATSLTLAAGAIVDVRADYSGVSDKVAVTGAAALNGATLSIKASPKVDATWADKKTFTVLTASSITGTFADVIQTDYAFLKFTAAYTATGVSVTSDRNWRSFGTYATSFNQKIAADIFDKFQTQTTNPVISRLTTLTVSQAPIALTQLAGTGVVATRTQSFAAGSVFSGAINSEMGRFTSSAGGSSSVLSYAEDTKIKSKAFDKIAPKPEPIPDGRIWAQMLGGIGNMKSDANNPSQRGSNYGLATGADTAINANLRAGFALSLGQSTTKVSSLATSTESTWGQGALYAVATDGDTYLKGALTYGYLDSKTDRSVTAFGTVDKAKGKFGANLYSVRLEAGQKFAFDPVNLTPFLAFEPSWLMQNAYNETGPASITLGFGKTTSRALPATLGGRIDASYDLGDYRMTPSASLGWVHDFASSGSISPFFTALPGSNFTAQGSRNDRNLARAELNIEASPKDTWATIYLNARADVGARTNAVRGVAGMSLRF